LFDSIKKVEKNTETRFIICYVLLLIFLSVFFLLNQ